MGDGKTATLTEERPQPLARPAPQLIVRPPEPTGGTSLYWRRTRRLAVFGTIAWLVFALLVPLAAQQLEAVAVMGIPLGYYAGAQGLLIAFALILLLATRRQRKIDRLGRAAEATAGEGAA